MRIGTAAASGQQEKSCADKNLLRRTQVFLQARLTMSCGDFRPIPGVLGDS
jgi:hypothetical protein